MYSELSTRCNDWRMGSLKVRFGGWHVGVDVFLLWLWVAELHGGSIIEQLYRAYKTTAPTFSEEAENPRHKSELLKGREVTKRLSLSPCCSRQSEFPTQLGQDFPFFFPEKNGTWEPYFWLRRHKCDCILNRCLLQSWERLTAEKLGMMIIWCWPET